MSTPPQNFLSHELLIKHTKIIFFIFYTFVHIHYQSLILHMLYLNFGSGPKARWALGQLSRDSAS